MINTFGNATFGAMNSYVEMTTNAVKNAQTMVNEKATLAINKLVESSFAYTIANATDE